MNKQQTLLENVSAISAVFHGDKRYAKFYAEQSESMGGFPAIWKFCVTAGEAFTECEPESGFDDGWIDSIDAFVEAIYASDGVPTDSELKTLAAAAIRKHGVPL